MLPGKNEELTALRIDVAARQQGLKEKEADLSALDARLVELEVQEKAITALINEVQVLENRITDGKAKTAEQRLRVDESENALKVVNESKAGKEAFDKVEASLTELRQKEQQRRGIEQEITGLEKEALDARFERVGEIPFSSQRKLMTTIHTDADAHVQERLLVFTKGAPDLLLGCCS